MSSPVIFPGEFASVGSREGHNYVQTYSNGLTCRVITVKGHITCEYNSLKSMNEFFMLLRLSG